MNIRDQVMWFDEKNEGQKSHDTVPLNNLLTKI
jgi:hypothetical protein